MEIAEELAKNQKAISVAEFFEKNRQILGFDSAPRALITCVKEAVDNSLDACEDGCILPDMDNKDVVLFPEIWKLRTDL